MKNLWLTMIAVAAGASGHHGWAAFDSKQSVTFKGTVTEFHFVSPHSVVEFEVKDEQGRVEVWQGELTSAARLTPKGWTATTLEPGDQVTITGNRAQSGVRTLRIMKIVSADGKDLAIVSGN